MTPLMSSVNLGTTLVPKRGKKAPPIEIVQHHRPDRASTVRTKDGDRMVMPWAMIRKTYQIVRGQ